MCYRGTAILECRRSDDMYDYQTLAFVTMDSILEREKKQLINEALDTLTEREAHILRARFYDERTLQNIADELRLSPERIRQIEAKALRKMRHPKRVEIMDMADKVPPVGTCRELFARGLL